MTAARGLSIGHQIDAFISASGGAVNARRPRSGRSAATSIDGAEHGDIVQSVMAAHENRLHPTASESARR